MDFDIVPKVLTITAGTRYYHFDNGRGVPSQAA